MYQTYRLNGKFLGVIRVADGAFIPNDPRNSDYQVFLQWNAAQQTPLDVTDQAYTPPADPDRATIFALLDKDANGTISAAEKTAFVYLVCKRLARGL